MRRDDHPNRKTTEGKVDGRLTVAPIVRGCEGALRFIVDWLCERDDREELHGGPGEYMGKEGSERGACGWRGEIAAHRIPHTIPTIRSGSTCCF